LLQHNISIHQHGFCLNSTSTQLLDWNARFNTSIVIYTLFTYIMLKLSIQSAQ